MGKIASRARLLGLSAAMAAGVALQPAVAQTVSDNGRGTAVFVPYYTVNDGWRTLLNVTNTSDNSLAVKVRLNDAQNSRDVLDFIVLLSPRDVWTAWVAKDGNGMPVVRTQDRSCTVPLSVRDSGAAGTATGYSNEFRDFTETNGQPERAREGYIEILVMGETLEEGNAPSSTDPTDPLFNTGDTAWYTKHENGEPRDCNIIQNDFVRRTAQWVNNPNNIIPGQDGSGSPLRVRVPPVLPVRPPSVVSSLMILRPMAMT